MNRIFEIIGAIHGNCTYVKDNLTEKEAHDFIDSVQRVEDGVIRYFWPDGDAIVGTIEECCFWCRVMHEYRSK